MAPAAGRSLQDSNTSAPFDSTTTSMPTPSQQLQHSASDNTVFSDSEREKKGPMKWIRNKLQERKGKEQRAKTPERSRGEREGSKQDLRIASETMPVRGKSFEGGQRAASGPAVVGQGVPATPTTGGAMNGHGGRGEYHAS